MLPAPLFGWLRRFHYIHCQLQLNTSKVLPQLSLTVEKNLFFTNLHCNSVTDGPMWLPGQPVCLALSFMPIFADVLQLHRGICTNPCYLMLLHPLAFLEPWPAHKLKHPHYNGFSALCALLSCFKLFVAFPWTHKPHSRDHNAKSPIYTWLSLGWRPLLVQ